MSIHAGNLPLLGGELCLDFTNTVEPRSSAHPYEYLTSYAHLLAWSANAGILTAEQVGRLRLAAEARPDEAEAALGLARSLREMIYRLFSAISRGSCPEVDDLEVFNTELGKALGRSRIIQDAPGFAWSWHVEDADLTPMLWPVIRSAADLITSDLLDRVKFCSGCGWLFVDCSRPGSRRWCDMRVCGNREKAHRHYQRTRQKPQN